MVDPEFPNYESGMHGSLESDLLLARDETIGPYSIIELKRTC